LGTRFPTKGGTRTIKVAYQNVTIFEVWAITVPGSVKNRGCREGVGNIFPIYYIIFKISKQDGVVKGEIL